MDLLSENTVYVKLIMGTISQTLVYNSREKNYSQKLFLYDIAYYLNLINRNLHNLSNSLIFIKL